MPHLQFEMNFPVTKEEKTRFASAAIRYFSEIMDTGTDHIAVTLRCFGPEDLTFGRAAPSGGRTAFVNASGRGAHASSTARAAACCLSW